jgi:hypothetical protein
VVKGKLNDPDSSTTTNKDFWQQYSPTAWIDMYNESIRNVERINELYKESVKSTERMIELYKQSITISERMIELYKETAKNTEKVTYLYKESVKSIERMIRYWQDLFQNPWWPPTKEGVQKEKEKEE